MDDYISVSQIVGQFRKYVEGPESVEAMLRGQRVHDAIAKYLTAQVVPDMGKEEGYLESFRKWWVKENLEVVMVEKELVDDFLEVCGRVDCVVRAPQSKKMILMDFKTSLWSDAAIWRLQGGWYHRLLTKNLYPMDDRMIFVQLHRDGSEAYEFVYWYNHELFDPMMAAMKMARYFQKTYKPLAHNSAMDLLYKS